MLSRAETLYQKWQDRSSKFTQGSKVGKAKSPQLTGTGDASKSPCIDYLKWHSTEEKPREGYLILDFASHKRLPRSPFWRGELKANSKSIGTGLTGIIKISGKIILTYGELAMRVIDVQI